MSSIGPAPGSHEQFSQSLPLDALAELLGEEEINEICRTLHYTWRERFFTPTMTVRSCVHRALNGDHSIAAMLDDLAALGGPDVPAPTDSAWCQARSRIPLEVFRELIRRKATECQRRFGRPYQWDGRLICRIDGSTVSMPDEPALAKAFGYAPTRHGPSRFPVARITFVELAGLNTIWDYHLDDYRTSEDEQFERMWASLPPRCICVVDKKFSSFRTLAKLRQRGIDVVTLLHQKRDPWRLIRAGRQVGANEWIVPLDLSPQSRKKYNDPTLPEILKVRLIRMRFRHGRRWRTLWVITTLLDRNRYPRRWVTGCYHWRWGVEGQIGSLKTTLQMSVLRSKKPQTARREVASIVLGHNLAWMLIHESAEKHGIRARDISFAGAVKTAVAFSQTLVLIPPSKRPALREKMLRQIARQVNHHPFGRVEPRMVKRDKRRFPYLKVPRDVARATCLS